MRSITRKPKLCGVNSYCPGLPSPTISFIASSVVRRATAFLFLFLLLSLLRSSSLPAFFRSLLLTLLHDLRLSRSCGCTRDDLRRRRFFFLNADNVRNRLVCVGQKLQLVAFWK